MHKNSLFGFAFAGTFVGWFLGGVLGIVNAPAEAFIYFIIGSIGLSGIVCGLLGMSLGVLHPWVPPNLHMRVCMRWVINSLSPRDQDGLRLRTQTVAFIWVLLLGAVLALPTLVSAFEIIMSRLQSPELAAGAGALLSLAFGATILALGLLARNALARVLESAVRRRPHLSVLIHPMGNTTAALILGSFIALTSPLTTSTTGNLSNTSVRVDSASENTAAQNGPASASMASSQAGAASAETPRTALGRILRFCLLSIIAFVLSSIMGEVLLNGMLRLPTGRGLQLLFLCIFCSVICTLVGLRSPQARDRLGLGNDFSRLAVEMMRLPFDRDDDGFSSVLGGGDCNDDDAAIHPGAKEVYGNPVDENCDGKAPQKSPQVAESKPVVPTVRDYGFRPPYSIVLITIDGFRPDHLGFFGYGVETSPALDDLAGESVVFPRAYTTSSVMQMAMGSIMAGKYPSELERDNQLFPKFGDKNVFLAELLSSVGYHTAGFPSHWYFGQANGLEQGFNVWQPYVVEKGRMSLVPTAETVMTAAVEHLSRIEPDPKRPYFMWLHLLDPLPNYLDHLDVPRFGDAKKARYDHEIRYVDTWLQWFIQTLRRRDDWNRTVLIVVGSSGTDFIEGGEQQLTEGNLRVPMIMRVPGLRARPVNQATSLIDLAPTLLDLAGITEATRPDDLQGRGLMERMLGRPVPDQPVYGEVPKTPENPLKMAWVNGNLKLNFDGSKNRWRLFDIARDPFEQNDVYEMRPQIGARLKRQLQGYRSQLQLQGNPIAQ